MEFPYAALKSKEFLLSITPDNFLDDSSIFFDSLSGEDYDSQKISRIYESFRNSGCKTLFDFLNHYLYRDVMLLAQILLKNIDSFFEQGINYILQKQYTISSVAYAR
jgi:hypothetical protein